MPDPADARPLLHRAARPVHGGYSGEVVAQDEYLACVGCGWAFLLDGGDDDCYRCGGELEVRRCNPAPESTLRLAL